MVKIVIAKKAKEDKKFKPRKLAYCIDRYEYPGKGKVPKGNVSRGRAAAICRGLGKRLCTASEWMRACGARLPYGKQYKQDYCNVAVDISTPNILAPAGTYEKCRSPYGVYDMVGNVEEWVSNGRLYGGSARTPGEQATCRWSTRRFLPDKYSGFRCCADPKLPQAK